LLVEPAAPAFGAPKSDLGAWLAGGSTLANSFPPNVPPDAGLNLASVVPLPKSPPVAGSVALPNGPAPAGFVVASASFLPPNEPPDAGVKSFPELPNRFLFYSSFGFSCSVFSSTFGVNENAGLLASVPLA
jgi:hypothetical protein